MLKRGANQLGGKSIGANQLGTKSGVSRRRLKIAVPLKPAHKKVAPRTERLVWGLHGMLIT